MCSKGCVCVCVFVCAPFLAGVYVSALIWQALLGCRQAGSWIMAPALLAGRTHLKEQQVENGILFFFCLSAPLLLYLRLSFCPSSLSLGWEMATAQIGRSCGRFGKRLFPPLTLSLPTLCVVIDWREVTFKMKSRSVRKNVKAFMLSHGININSSLPTPLPSCLPLSSLFAYSPLLYPFPFSIVSLAQ